MQTKTFLCCLWAIVLTSCISNNTSIKNKSEQPLNKTKDPGGRMTDFLGSVEYELNLLKDPKTGTIPEGIREMELAQARQILRDQSWRSRAMANAYSFQGPENLGGRTRALAYDVRYNGTTNQIIMAGGVSGGIYKSTDNGVTWVRKSPTGQHFSCTSVAQDPRAGNQDTWYYTTGEASGNSAGTTGAFYTGNGVYKSTDNGETWTRLPNSNTTVLETFTVGHDIISKVIVNPTNGDVYISCAAAIRRSQDGGNSWTTVLSGALVNSGQHTDIIVTTGGRLYAGFSGTNADTADGVWTSTTGNLMGWTRIAGTGVATDPAGWDVKDSYGRVVLAVAPSNQNSLYVLYYDGDSYPNIEAEFYKYDQATGTWSDRSANLPNEPGGSSGNDPFAVQGGYDLVIAVKPDDENVVFIGGTNIYRSTDGFATTANTTRLGGYAGPSTYALYSNSHPDIHAIVFPPTSTTTMLCGNDGGIQRTTNNLAATVTWSQINVGYRTYQYYYVAVDPRNGNNKVIGGAQDNGTTRNIGGTGVNFEQVLGGDGVSVGLSNDIGGVFYEYVGWQNGDIFRRNVTSCLGCGTGIRPTTATGNSLFITLFYLDPDNTQTLYYAIADSLFRTNSASTVTTTTWTLLTGLTTAIGGNETITALATTRGAYSATTSSLFVGDNSGDVYRLDDPVNAADATAPVNITGGSFPPTGYISSIAVNPRNDDTILVTFSNYSVTSIWWTGNANSATPTWHNVEGNLTLPSIRSSAITISAAGIEYYVGTSMGLYRATVNGASPGTTVWSQEGASEMGNAVVSSLALRTIDNKLVIGTHGYGIWQTTIGGPLPVTLKELKGKLEKDNVVLDWKTTAESNALRFDVERSYDGMIYKKIGVVQAAGNSSTGKYYNFRDIESAAYKNYYRLKIVDIDGRSALSEIVLIKKPGSAQRLFVVNPFSNYIEIRFAHTPANVRMTLTDMSGKKLGTAEYNGLSQAVIRFANIPSLSKGVYILRTEADGEIFTNKIVKQ